MFFIRAFLLICVTFAIYSVMLSSWFKTMDDQFSIVSNQTIQDRSLWPQLFKEGYFRDHSYYRPLTNLSYAFEYQAFGLKPFNYNLDNILIHIANAFLVWCLVAIIINVEVGFWVALLFAIHPVQWESVANISGRAILLSAFFSFLTFIFYTKKKYIFSIIFFALGLLCKESTAIVPGIIFAYAVLYRRKISPIVFYVPILLIYMYIRHSLAINEFFAWRNVHEAAIGFATFLNSVILYLRLMVLPVDMHFDRSLKLFDSLTQAGAIFTMGFWALGVGALIAIRKHLQPIHLLALVWFGLTLMPISQIVTTIGTQPGYISCAEHFLYVTCIPIFIVVVLPLYKIQSKIVRTCFVALFIYFGLTTLEQNIYARSELAMMERSLAFQPQNARLNSSVGLIHAMNGRFEKAEFYFRKAVAYDSQNSRYLISLGKSVCDQERYEECMVIYNAIQEPGRYKAILDENKAAAEKLMKEIK